MKSIKPVFARAAAPDSGFSTFWLLVFAIVILDNAAARDKKRRTKRDRQAQPQRRPRPPAGPQAC
jgi:hypothetical protein